MVTASQNLYLSISIQLLLTLFLVALLWSLYARLQRFEFFRWWAWAWTSFSVFLGGAAVSLSLGPVWTPLKALLLLVILVSGLLQPVLLVFGGLSWRAPNKPSRRLFRWGISLTLLTAILSFAVAFIFRGNPVASFASRNLLRLLAHAGALMFCCLVFWRQFRRSRSYAAAITGIFCLSYAGDQLLYFLTLSELAGASWGLHYPGLIHRLAAVEFSRHPWLLYFDLVDTCGICLGMILLLLERQEQTAFELEASEQRRLGLAVDNVSLQIQIQERERVEQELRRSEEFSRQVVLNSPVAMVVTRGPRETVVFMNEKFTLLFGYAREEIQDVYDWWPRAYPDPGYRQSIQTSWRDLIAKANRGTASKLTMEARVRCKDGSFREVEFHLSLVNDLYLISFVDLTERNRTLAGLRESESRYRDLVEHSEDLLGTHDLDGRILSINQAPCRRLGYAVEEVLQMRLQDLLAPRYRPFFPEFVQRVLQHGHDTGQMVVVTRSGQERVWEYTSTLRRDGVPNPVIRGMARDITD